MRLGKKKSGRTISAEPFAPTDPPSSLSVLATRARPVRIMAVDVEQPLPQLRADSLYDTVYVLFRCNGVYCGEVTIDLTVDATYIQYHLREAAAPYKVARVNEPRRSVLADRRLPRISIVVPTVVERVEELQRCIETIEGLDYPDFELILVDNRKAVPENDPLPELVADRPWLRVIRESRPGISAARNQGVAHADGSIIAFTDDDVQVDRGWLRAIGMRLCTVPQLDAVTGLVLPSELESPAQIWFERYYGGFSGQRTFDPLTLEADPRSGRILKGSRIVTRDAMGSQVTRFPVYGVGAYAAGANMAFRKSALERVGGFDVALGTGTPARGGEDLATVITVLWTGGLVGYEPSAVVHHRHRRNYDEMLNLMDGEGVGCTAMLTSLVLHDPRHLVGLFSQFPSALKKLVVQQTKKVRGMSANGVSNRPGVPLFPAELAKREFRAYLRGPQSYLRSRTTWRRVVSEHRSVEP